MVRERNDAWRGLTGTTWQQAIDVAGFIHDNVTPYTGDATFLTGPTHRTERLWRAPTTL